MSNEKSCASTSINWYPGHMAKTRRQIESDIKIVDIVIELLDARIPISSQNPDIAQIISKKKKIVVLNKGDLADDNKNKQWLEYFQKRGIPAVITDSSSGRGIDNCIKEIEKIMEDKEVYKSDKNNNLSVPIIKNDKKDKIYNSQIVYPIISNGDSIGTVILLSKEASTKMTDVEAKVAQSAASFLGSQMEI